GIAVCLRCVESKQVQEIAYHDQYRRFGPIRREPRSRLNGAGLQLRGSPGSHGPRIRVVRSRVRVIRDSPAQDWPIAGDGSPDGASSLRFLISSTMSTAACAPSTSPCTSGLSLGIERAARTVGNTTP